MRTSNGVTPEEAAEVFTKLWPLYCAQPLAGVEVFAFAGGCTFKACINWADGGWHILADSSRGAYEAFCHCFHELGHVVNGDLRPGMKHQYTVGERRRQAKGALLETVGERAKVGKPIAVAWPHLAEQERKADAWAYSKASTAWATWCGWRDIDETIRVLRWVQSQQEQEDKS